MEVKKTEINGKMLVLAVTILLLVAMCSGSSPTRLKKGKMPVNCHYNNKTYRPRERFRPEPCKLCRCPKRGGRTSCTIMDCIWDPACLRRDEDNTACCPRCLEYGCIHTDRKTYRKGEVVSRSKCETCYCPESGGRTECLKHYACRPVPCVNPIVLEGRCCPVCPNGPNCLTRTGMILAAGADVTEDEYHCTCPELHLLRLGVRKAVCKSIEQN